MELNREQIVKALDAFHNRILSSKLSEKVTESEMMAVVDALALIQELTEENERLNSINKPLVTNNSELETELAQTYDLLEKAKADTVRKMQEELVSEPLAIFVYEGERLVTCKRINDVADKLLREVE